MSGNGPVHQAVGSIAGEVGRGGRGIRSSCNEATDHGQLSQRRRCAEPTEVVLREEGRIRMMEGRIAGVSGRFVVKVVVRVAIQVVVVVVVEAGRGGGKGVAKVVFVLETGVVWQNGRKS